MVEPKSTTSAVLAAIATAAMSPLAGQYAVIVILSLLGSLVTLSRLEGGRISGAWFLFRSVAVASAVAIPMASAAGHFFNTNDGLLTPINVLALVAFCLGLKTDAALDLIDSLARGLMDKAVTYVVNRIDRGKPDK